MPNNPNAQWQPSNPQSLAKRFRSLGWIGFWTQLALLTIPIALLVYVIVLSGPDSSQRRGIELSNYLSYGSLLVILSAELMVLSFTLWLLFRTTRPSPAETEKTA